MQLRTAIAIGLCRPQLRLLAVEALVDIDPAFSTWRQRECLASNSVKSTVTVHETCMETDPAQIALSMHKIVSFVARRKGCGGMSRQSR